MLILLIKYFRYKFLKKFLSLEFFIESLTRNKQIIPLFITECVSQIFVRILETEIYIKIICIFLYIQSDSSLMNYNIAFSFQT